jgi:hypothetical protein
LFHPAGLAIAVPALVLAGDHLAAVISPAFSTALVALPRARLAR